MRWVEDEPGGNDPVAVPCAFGCLSLLIAAIVVFDVIVRWITKR